ncbi:MAG: hypothetical protein HZA36_03135 [Parcubacteria group bacterium]|nr:hypothetical protein [Parcubacteria group bacterium]
MDEKPEIKKMLSPDDLEFKNYPSKEVHVDVFLEQLRSEFNDTYRRLSAASNKYQEVAMGRPEYLKGPTQKENECGALVRGIEKS